MIRHHFLHEHVANSHCEIKFRGTKLQLVDLFTKPLAKERFNFLRNELSIISLNSSQQ